VTPQGKPVYIANLTVSDASIKIEIQKPSKHYPTLEFKHTPEDLATILSIFSTENIKGVRLIGKNR
jgi:hypothetical protein